MATEYHAEPNDVSRYPARDGEIVVQMSTDVALVGSTAARTVQLCYFQEDSLPECLPTTSMLPFCIPKGKWVCIDVPEGVVEAIRGIIGVLT